MATRITDTLQRRRTMTYRLAPRSFALQTVLTLVSFSWISKVLAQTPINGQIFTNGLSIINAPAINSEHNAGGNIPISIEVSGNGRVQFAGLIPNSGLPTAYEEINIFLVSAQTSVNLTVTAGPRLLTDEDGSVRHFDYQIPSCIRPGLYNMTFYETSRLENTPLYVITPIPISIRNPSPSGEGCTEGTNELQVQPQPDARAPQSPFLPGGFSPSPTLMTVTMTEGARMPSVPPPGTPTTVVTMVIESPVLTTQGGQTGITTTTFTTTAAMRTQDLFGFIPVTSDNAAHHLSSRRTLHHIFAIALASALLYQA